MVWFAVCLVLGAAVIFVGTQYRSSVVSSDLFVQPEGQLERSVQLENQFIQLDLVVNQSIRFPQNFHLVSLAGLGF